MYIDDCTFSYVPMKLDKNYGFLSKFETHVISKCLRMKKFLSQEIFVTIYQ